MKEKAIVLLSGGLDSAANLAFAFEQDSVVLALTFNYGQRAFRAENQAAKKFCEYYGVCHQTLEIPWLKHLGSSALTSTQYPVPQLKTEELDDKTITKESAKKVWVPNRNGLFVNIAACFGEDLKAQKILVGFNKEEAASFPDNSEKFMNAITQSLHFSTKAHVRVDSYTVHLTKEQIVQKLRTLQKPFVLDWVWSCYEGYEKPCGTCESCKRLERALGRKT
jgi:7-cyano-7-deazaguanine synthase